MARKPKPTRTLNPLHFEDLEPHRFEDLVRRLLYNFRDWSDIEPTGRAGADEGFDIRAWEKGESISNMDDNGEEGTHAIQGKLWQIQGKREKTVNPAKMKTLIQDGVDARNPPYGYILAAATNISKASYDLFRSELRKKGVRECYFWGKDYLEDQLAFPHNDEILFTFFGISLSPRRRSRTAEIKFNLNNKNRILRLFFDKEEKIDQPLIRRRPFLLRDIKDTHYPFSGEYPDFEQRRRWEEHSAVHVTATGVYFQRREFYAYLDPDNRQWDFSRFVDLTPRKNNLDKANERRIGQDGKVAEAFWRHLPRNRQAKLRLYGFVRFEDMLIIDDKGDPVCADPHIFIDFSDKNGPFSHFTAKVIVGHTLINSDELEKDYKKIEHFPKDFPPLPSSRKTHGSEEFGIGEQESGPLQWNKTLYSFDGRLNRMSIADLLEVKDGANGLKHFEVTYVYEATVTEILRQHGDHMKEILPKIAGRAIAKKDKVTVYEMCEVYLIREGEIMYGADSPHA